VNTIEISVSGGEIISFFVYEKCLDKSRQIYNTEETRPTRYMGKFLAIETRF
jgi:hypothetical protein